MTELRFITKISKWIRIGIGDLSIHPMRKQIRFSETFPGVTTQNSSRL